jgi:signal transduction histidine kinase
MKISNKMVMLVGVPLFGMLVLLAVAIPLINRVKVGGPEYNKIAQAAELKADILPPPEYLVESMLVVNQLATGQDPASMDQTVLRLEGLKTAYYARNEYWKAHLTLDAIKKPFLEASFVPANLFWKEVDEKFVPAIKEGRLADAQVIAYVDLTALYKQHRAAIDQTVALTDSATSVTEADVSATVSRKMLTMVLLLVAVGGGVLLLGIAFGRSISLPIRRLTKRAQKAATEDLPRVIDEVQNSPADAEIAQLEPFVVDGEDELSDLAKAFNSMQDTSVRLASEQARMRRNVSEMFANLGRRNQGLLNRTISLISELEQSERDPKMLEDLFRIDHLTTRIRRNADSLLVLAGSDPNRMWSKPIEIGDVIRTALSAIESYDRVDFDQVQPVQFRGNIVNDVAHLFAELIENATNFSPPSTRVSIVGKMIHDGYVLSIIDQGLGMSPPELEDAQRRIDEVSNFDMAPSKVLGLNVVGRIALRLGIVVRLTESPSDGVTAKVRLPFSLIEGRDRDAAPAAEPEAAEPATYAEYTSAPVSVLATASAAPISASAKSSADPQSLHEFAMEWSTTLPPPEPGTMYGSDDDDIDDAAMAAAEHTAQVAKDLATRDQSSPKLKRRRAEKHDITSRQLPPLFDWTAAADTAETDEQDWKVGTMSEPALTAGDEAAPAPAVTRSENADLWGVGTSAEASSASTTDHIRPAAAPAVHDWGLTPDTPDPLTEAVAFEPLFPFEAPASAVAEVRVAEVPVAEIPVEVPVLAEVSAWAVVPPVDTPAVTPAVTAADTADASAPSTSAAAGLAKRVRGAQMPDTGPATGVTSDPNRSAADVRSALSRFQSGVRKGQEDADQTTDD